MTTETPTKTCPPWCDLRHTTEDEDCHSFNTLSEIFAGVGVEEDERTGIRIFVDVAGDTTLSIDEAVRVATAIVEAVRLAGTPSYSTAEVAHILGVSVATVEALAEVTR